MFDVCSRTNVCDHKFFVQTVGCTEGYHQHVLNLYLPSRQWTVMCGMLVSKQQKFHVYRLCNNF